MRDVAIIGAGELGGSLAYALARRGVASEIRLVDDAGRVAEGKALDIAQAAPIEGFATRLSASTDVSAIAGACVVVLADRVEQGEWKGEEGLALLRRVAPLAPGAALVCAGASSRELIERGVRDLRITRNRLFGSAPEALAGAARAMVALAIDGSPRDVGLTVLGVPPAQIVIPWSEATIGGFAATRVLDEPSLRRIAARIAALWPPGSTALAAAATAVLEGICGRSRRIITCFVAPDDTGGTRTRTAALPVRIGAAGIEHVALPTLSVHERVLLDNAMLL